ncbi:MAG: UvrD-helicase domain-containing protein, partial [Eubacteriales bacterium]
MDFTYNQNLAINLRNRNILVSAGAGSGKTATLTERIIRLLTDKENPTDISRMLIVTFTRAAAGELRTRISKKLSDALALDPSNRHLARQLTSLAGAKICTIDSYYLDLVKSNFQKLGLPAKFRLADETEFKILRNEIMNSVIERRYETDGDFSDYADAITTAKAESKLSEVLLELADKIVPLPEGTKILERNGNDYSANAEVDFFNTAIGKLMRSELKAELEYLLKRTDRLLHLIDQNPEAAPYGRAVSGDRDHIERLINAANDESYANMRSVVFDYSPITLGTIRSSESSEITLEIKAERTDIKKRLTELKEREFLTDPEDMPAVCRANSDFCKKTKEVLDDYCEAYTSEKAARTICEFADLRKYALALLTDNEGKPTTLALEEQKKYDHIFVDEYQDTDYVQDLVFQTISNGKNLFFVGDIKQSIYSFRGAEPSVFSSYRKSYALASSSQENGSTPTSVFMSENFRCSPNVISFTNAVCSYLFRETEGKGHGIGYVAEDDLIASRSAPVSDAKVKIALIEKDEESDNSTSPECAYVIESIRSILKEKRLPSGEPYRPRDIAILTRTKSEAQAFANALGKAGIAHANSTGDDLFENPEVLLMLCLLSTADNPQRDIPLAGALRSPIFGFSLSDLVNIRSGRATMSLFDALCDYANDDESEPHLKEKVVTALSKIDEYRTEAEAMPVHTFIRYLWKDTNAAAYSGSASESSKRTLIERRRNLRSFYEYARKFEASSFKGLHDFVEYVNGIISQGTKISSEDAVTDDTVQIMTVHKSKGLEFPTVFLVGCARLPNDMDSRKPIVFSSSANLGIAFKIPDVTGFGQMDTPYRIAVADKIRSDSSEEEIRILYVALTRARDELRIVASGKPGFAEKHLSDAIRRAAVGGRFSVMSAPKWIDRILTALAADPLNKSYSIELPTISGEGERDDVVTSKKLDENEIERLRAELRVSFDFQYPYREFKDVPAKVSVSKLYPELLNDPEDQYDTLLKAQNLETRIPRFMGGSDNAAEKGTATHLFMQFCDFSRLLPSEISVTEEISRLVADRYINQNIAKLIRVNEIVNFVKTDMFADIRDAHEAHREFRFNIFLPASRFTTSKELSEAL